MSQINNHKFPRTFRMHQTTIEALEYISQEQRNTLVDALECAILYLATTLRMASEDAEKDDDTHALAAQLQTEYEAIVAG